MKRFLLIPVLGLPSISAMAGPPDLDKAMVAWAAPEPVPTYRYALTDLNGDGSMDAVVLALGSFYCGSGGCRLAIFKGVADGFEAVSSSSISREPIYLHEEAQAGWRTLSVLVTGGGAEPGQALLRFDGKKYPSNPSLQKRATESELKSAQQLSFK